MKVQELRQLLSTADRALLEKAFVESYKHFSKNQKEEVDLVINGVLEGKEEPKSYTGEPVFPGFDVLYKR